MGRIHRYRGRAVQDPALAVPGFFLVLGLGTEAVIFFFSAFEPPHEDVDWSLVYPELAGMGDDDHGKREKRKKADPVAQKLDALMADAKIGPEPIESRVPA